MKSDCRCGACPADVAFAVVSSDLAAFCCRHLGPLVSTTSLVMTTGLVSPKVVGCLFVLFSCLASGVASYMLSALLSAAIPL